MTRKRVTDRSVALIALDLHLRQRRQSTTTRDLIREAEQLLGLAGRPHPVAPVAPSEVRPANEAADPRSRFIALVCDLARCGTSNQELAVWLDESWAHREQARRAGPKFAKGET